MTADLERMTARELCAGLMRGDRVSMKTGYSPEAAAMAAAGQKGLDEDQLRDLLSYARGFADGMAEAIEANDPATRFGRFGEPTDFARSYAVGYSEGRDEVGFFLYPALKAVEG